MEGVTATVVLGIIGILSTLAASLGAPALQRRAEDRRWVRDERRVAYVDFLSWVGPNAAGAAIDQQRVVEASARAQLVGSQGVRDAATRLVVSLTAHRQSGAAEDDDRANEALHHLIDEMRRDLRV